jgi:transcriptional regulator with XRE-family HTH domain
MTLDESTLSLPIGEKIRRLREGAALSIDQLAHRAGIKSEELEHIERDMMSPALGVLISICNGLGVRLGHFFDQGPRKAYSLVRAAERQAHAHFGMKNGTDFGQDYYSLASEKRERVMEPFMVTVTAPSDPSGKSVELEQFTTHLGEEFIYVLEGEIEVQIDDQTYVLKVGDSIYYDSTVAHRVSQHGSGHSRALTVVYLPRKN